MSAKGVINPAVIERLEKNRGALDAYKIDKAIKTREAEYSTLFKEVDLDRRRELELIRYELVNNFTTLVNRLEISSDTDIMSDESDLLRIYISSVKEVHSQQDLTDIEAYEELLDKVKTYLIGRRDVLERRLVLSDPPVLPVVELDNVIDGFTDMTNNIKKNFLHIYLPGGFTLGAGIIEVYRAFH